MIRFVQLNARLRAGIGSGKMRKHVLFFIHGMGRHYNTWHEPGLQVLRSVFDDYDGLRGLDFDEIIDPIPVVYDDKIERWRQRMAADFQAFRGGIDWRF